MRDSCPWLKFLAVRFQCLSLNDHFMPDCICRMALLGNMTSSAKPEVHNVLHSQWRTKESRPQVTCRHTKIFVKLAHVVSEICERHICTQYRQTDHNSLHSSVAKRYIMFTAKILIMSLSELVIKIDLFLVICFWWTNVNILISNAN